MIAFALWLVAQTVTFGSDDLWAIHESHSSSVTSVALSPDGATLAYVANGEIVVADASTGRARRRIGTRACNHVAVANGGAIVACDEARYVNGARDTADDPIPRATPGRAAPSSAFPGRPDEWLARTLDGKWRVRREGKRVLLLGAHTPVVLEPNVTPALTSSMAVWARIAIGGAVVAVGTGDGANLFRTRDGALIAHVADGLRIFDMMFSADGALAAYAAPAGVVVLDARTGKERGLVKGARAEHALPALSGDGGTLALSTSSGTELFATTASPAASTRIPFPARALALSHDGALLALAHDEGAVRLFRRDGARWAELVLDRVPGAATAELSADGARLVVTAEDAVRSYDAATGALLTVTPGDRAIPRGPPYPRRDDELTAAERPALLTELPGAQVLDLDRARHRALVGMDTVYVVELAPSSRPPLRLSQEGTARFAGDGRVVSVEYFRAGHALVLDPATGREDRLPLLAGARLAWVRGDRVLVRRGGRFQLLTLPAPAR